MSAYCGVNISVAFHNGANRTLRSISDDLENLCNTTLGSINTLRQSVNQDDHKNRIDDISIQLRLWKIEATGAEESLQPFQQKYTQEADAAATVLNIASKRIEEARLNNQFENRSNLTYVKHAVARLS